MSNSDQSSKALIDLISNVRPSSLRPFGGGWSENLKSLSRVCASNPAESEKIKNLCFDAALSSSWLGLVCDFGMHQQMGFWSEAFDRIIRKFLPYVPQANDFGQVLLEIEPLLAEDKGLLALGELISVLGFNQGQKDQLLNKAQKELKLAMRLLVAQYTTGWASREMRELLQVSISQDSSVFKFIEALQAENYTLCLKLLADIKKELKLAHAHIESSGVTLKIIFQFDLLHQLLDRIEKLLFLQIDIASDRSWKKTSDFVVEQILEKSKVEGLSAFLSDNLKWLSRKIVERTGKSGEHYITRNRAEYFAMLWSAGGGGALTAFTSAAKTILGHLTLPLFFEGFLSFLNYSGSFLLMQFTHLTLATKQPSMTASSLSGKLIEKDVRKDVDGFVAEVKQIVRSQFAAAVGNIGFVIPTAILVSIGYQSIMGHEFLHSAEAIKYLESFNPLTSGSLFYATITGVLLWLASVAGGWVENWFVYRKLGEAMTHSRNLKKVFGVDRMGRVSRWFGVNVGGLVSNVTLGFLLAFVPIGGKFFGLPIEVRHVTLSMGSLAFSVYELGSAFLMKEIVLFAFAGILLIGILNFVSSFVLSLAVACVAREVKIQDVFFLMRSIGLEFLRRPFDFFRPPKV